MSQRKEKDPHHHAEDKRTLTADTVPLNLVKDNNENTEHQFLACTPRDEVLQPDTSGPNGQEVTVDGIKEIISREDSAPADRDEAIDDAENSEAPDEKDDETMTTGSEEFPGPSTPRTARDVEKIPLEPARKDSSCKSTEEPQRLEEDDLTEEEAERKVSQDLEEEHKRMDAEWANQGLASTSRLEREDSGYQSNTNKSSGRMQMADGSFMSTTSSLNGSHESLPDLPSPAVQGRKTPAQAPESLDDIANYIHGTRAPVTNETAVTPDPLRGHKRDGERVRKRLFVETAPAAERSKPRKRRTKSQRSGLVFPVARIINKLRKGRYARKVGVGAGVYLAAAMEYLVAEVLELAGNFTHFHKRTRITPRSILLTLKHDAELDQLTPHVIIPQGGVRPNINPVLLPPNQQQQALDAQKGLLPRP